LALKGLRRLKKSTSLRSTPKRSLWKLAVCTKYT
jgi:hypothetical protein